MLLFNKRKAMYAFYDKHKVFLYWYLTKHSGIHERHYHLLNQYMVKCMTQDIEKLVRCNERQQREWIMRQIDNFSAGENRGEHGE